MAALTDDLQWVNDDLPSEQFDNKVQDVAIRTARGQLTVLDLVKALGAQLTTDSAARRGRAVLLLAGVVQSLPSLTEAEANVLTAFFAAKLADWEVVGVGFKGCLALLAGPDGQARLASKDAVAVARSLLDNVHVPQLGITDRKEGLQLLLALLQLHGPALVEAEVDMIEGVLASVDGEKDPRCLLLAFQAVRAVVTLYSTTTPAALAALQKSAEEFGDMLSCYFPIMFKPPPNSAHAITREDLAGELERTMAASALLAPHVLPLLLEKLASSLMQSKKDALSALVACTRGYGAKGIGPYFSSIWSAIRNELLFSEDDSSASPRPRPQPSSTAPEASQGQSVAEQAADCLAACIGALEAAGNRDLVTLALRDASLEGMFADEADLGLGAGLASWDLALANCLKNARLYAAVARGSAFACKVLGSQVLPRLLKSASRAQDASPSARVGMVADVLTGTATLAKAGKVLPASSVHSAARLVQMATSGCAAGSHSSISQQAALLVSEASQALAPTHQTANALDPTQGLFGQTAVVAAAAVAGLQPTAVPAGAAQELVGELLGLVHRLREPMDAECAAVAAAALLAKLPAGSPELDAAVEGSLSPVPGSAAAGPAHTARGFMALAWVTKALAMRGDARAEQGVHAALRLQDGPLADQALLKAVLEAVSESILDKQGQAAVEQQVARVIDMLCQLARYKPSADTRETALRCLSHHYVLQTIAQALGDPKRRVVGERGMVSEVALHTTA
ncbi:hypothetical protein WJX72_005960 [[Myrmecia] bisecta]|uniref:MMS19 nucleotide excision repair protein n=1 Tax=[Myrmecia] bisecta TaxID=41462 RepID=A0AAW1QQP0_9CHLO